MNTLSKEAKSAAEAIVLDPTPFAKERFSEHLASIIDRLACAPFRARVAELETVLTKIEQRPPQSKDDASWMCAMAAAALARSGSPGHVTQE